MKTKPSIAASLLEWFEKFQTEVLAENINEEIKENLNAFYVNVAYSVFMIQTEEPNNLQFIKWSLKEINSWMIPYLEKYWSLSNSGVLTLRDVTNVCKISWTTHARKQALARDPKAFSILEKIKDAVLKRITDLNIPDENQRYFLIIHIFDDNKRMIGKTALIVVLKRTLLGRPEMTVVTTIGRKSKYFIMDDAIPIELNFMRLSHK